MAAEDSWQSPLGGRYASKEMLYLFSYRNRSNVWRQLWIWLAESQQELGIPMPDGAIDQLRAAADIEQAEFAVIAEEEKRRRHDVMAHVHALGIRAPAAAGIIHWGATSCYVTDNGDLITIRDALTLLIPKVARCIQRLSDFASEHKSLACLGYTHGQPAMLITVGRRAAQWTESLLMDLRNLERIARELPFRGVKGTTGTQASFLQMFKGDHEKVKQLDQMVTTKAGFAKPTIISVQTYNRKVDVEFSNVLSSFGTTCEHIGRNIRHLVALKEMDEPLEAGQIGSSAMAFKQNPMRSERMSSLGRKLSSLNSTAAATFAHQWLERSLDDSATRRIDIPEIFLCADAIAMLLDNILAGMIVYPAIVHRRVQEELPYMATEYIITRMVENGASRQEAHEHIRVLSHEAAMVVKQEGKDNDLVARIKNDPFFAPVVDELTEDQLLNPASFIGRAPQQVEEFIREEVKPALEPYQNFLNASVAELHV